jgi:hypothetical protein
VGDGENLDERNSLVCLSADRICALGRLLADHVYILGVVDAAPPHRLILYS